MKNLNKIAIAAVSLISLIIAGCSDSLPNPPPPKPKYTIWVGSAAFAVGYGANSFEEKDGKVVFINVRSGKQDIIPECSVLRIESN